MYNVYATKDIQKFLKHNAHNPHYDKHGLDVNKHFVVCGGTGLGKSNFVVSYLRQMQDTFQHVFVYTKDPSEEVYEFMKDKLKDQMTVESIDKVPRLKSIPKHGQSLIVFDDFITSSKEVLNILEEYSIMSRKQEFTCMYLTQSFFACPKKIRMNSKYLVLLSLTDKRNLDMITANLSVDIEPKTIKRIIANATKEKMNVCIINLQSIQEPNKIFRRNFHDFYQIMDENNEELETIQLYQGSGLLN